MTSAFKRGIPSKSPSHSNHASRLLKLNKFGPSRPVEFKSIRSLNTASFIASENFYKKSSDFYCKLLLKIAIHNRYVNVNSNLFLKNSTVFFALTRYFSSRSHLFRHQIGVNNFEKILAHLLA